MSDVKKFPGYRWSPEGEVRVFRSVDEVPAGWTDQHPSNLTPPVSKVVEPIPLTRQQIIDDLRRRSVVFQRNATTKSLYDLLVSEVERSAT